VNCGGAFFDIYIITNSFEDDVLIMRCLVEYKDSTTSKNMKDCCLWDKKMYITVTSKKFNSRERTGNQNHIGNAAGL
jgi:hypothetical protein